MVQVGRQIRLSSNHFKLTVLTRSFNPGSKFLRLGDHTPFTPRVYHHESFFWFVVAVMVVMLVFDVA